MTTGAVATGAAAGALLALILVAVALLAIRKVRAGQLIVLADGRADLIDFAVSLQARIDDLHKAVDEVASALTRVDKRVDGAVSNVAVVRYDAYEDRGGQQSATVALAGRFAHRHRRQRHSGS